MEAIRAGTGPVAVILSRPDPIIALGAILAEELYGLVVPVVIVGEEDRCRIMDGDSVKIDRDGVVTVGSVLARPGSHPRPTT